MMAPKSDQLTTLPSELLQNIASYLYTTHYPDRAFRDDSKREQSNAWSHDLESLAASCRTFRIEVNNWALHFLVEHRAITKVDKKKLKGGSTLVESAMTPMTINKKGNIVPSSLTQNNLRFGLKKIQAGLLFWSERHCVFCGKSSKRAAIMMNGMKCCNNCDKAEWKEKITMTAAKKVFDLKDYQLLPRSFKEVDSFEQLGIPRLRYGTYICQGGLTTMFMRKAVERFAEQVHGGLKEHMAQREARREESKKTREQNKEKRAEQQAAKDVNEAAEARRKAGQAAVEREAMHELVEISSDDENEFGAGNSMDDFILIDE